MIRRRTARLALCAGAVLLAASAQGSAADSPPDISGMWRNVPIPGESSFAFAADLPFTAETKEIVDHRTKLVAASRGVASAHLTCRPTGIMGFSSPRGPVLIMQTPDEVIFLSQEDREIRRVHLNREHAKDLKPSYNGDSIGHWEGATLVIDTVGFNERGEIDEKSSAPLSAQTHLTQRITLEGDRLSHVITVEDPVHFTRPFTTTRLWQRSPRAHLLNYDCAENPRSDDFANMTFETNWFKPTCVRIVKDGAADRRVTCKVNP